MFNYTQTQAAVHTAASTSFQCDTQRERDLVADHV